jgi:hypothetical protein
MRARTIALLVLLALVTTACGKARPPAPTATPIPVPTPTPTPKYLNDPEGAARRLLDSWQEYDADLYLDSIVPEDRQQINIFGFNEYGQTFTSIFRVQVHADRPRLKFRDLRFETQYNSPDSADVAVAGFIRELNVANEYEFSALIVTVQQGGVWRCKVSETKTSFPLLNATSGLQLLEQTKDSILGLILTPLAAQSDAGATPTVTPTPTDEFRVRALAEIQNASAFRVDIVDYSNGRETRSTYWQQPAGWRWLLPAAEQLYSDGYVCSRPVGGSLQCVPAEWPGRFRTLPILALSVEDFSSASDGDWQTYPFHVPEYSQGALDGVACRAYAMRSARDAEECCFDLATYRPLQCSYTLDGAKLVATYRDWGVLVTWEIPSQ